MSDLKCHLSAHLWTFCSCQTSYLDFRVFFRQKEMLEVKVGQAKKCGQEWWTACRSFVTFERGCCTRCLAMYCTPTSCTWQPHLGVVYIYNIYNLRPGSLPSQICLWVSLTAQASIVFCIPRWKVLVQSWRLSNRNGRGSLFLWAGQEQRSVGRGGAG